MPDFVIELATITLMVDGSVAGGPELPPAPLVHVPPQNAGLGVVFSAKPLKAEGAGPPLNLLDFAQFPGPERHVLPYQPRCDRQ